MTYEISLSSTLLRNGFPFLVKSKSHKKLLCKVFNRLNFKLKYGKFKINLFNGSIFVDFSTVMTFNQFYYLVI
jgi:hypothetical protein